MFTADAADCAQLLRHLGEQRGTAPNWRRARPALMVEAAEFWPAADGDVAGDVPGTLLLRCASMVCGELSDTVLPRGIGLLVAAAGR